MKHRGFVQLLSEYSARPDHPPAEMADALPSEWPAERKQEFRELLRLAGQVRDALVPVRPAPSFRRKLRADLTKLARQRNASNVVVDLPARPRELLIGAAIGSAVALAGGIAYLIRVRSQAQS